MKNDCRRRYNEEGEVDKEEEGVMKMHWSLSWKHS